MLRPGLGLGLAMSQGSDRHILAIDIGGTKIRAGVVTIRPSGDGDGEIDSEVSAVITIDTAPAPGQSVLDRVAELADRYGRVDAIGVGAAGVINNGRVVAATDLIPGWAGSDIAARLRQVQDVPVAVLGDAHAHGLAEARLGAGRKHPSTLAVAVGTGIGGAFVRAGEPELGDHGVAGHIGHILHPDSADLVCTCGRIGHIEPLASGTGLATAYTVQSGERVSGAEVARRAAAGEHLAVGILRRAGTALGGAVGSLANVLDPGIIVFTGSVTQAGSIWWDAVRAAYRDTALAPIEATPLVPGELGDSAPLLGAALFVQEHTAQSQGFTAQE